METTGVGIVEQPEHDWYSPKAHQPHTKQRAPRVHKKGLNPKFAARFEQLFGNDL